MDEAPAIAHYCAANFESWTGAKPEVVAWAPGRINVIGGHTDYNDGLAMPAAINRWISVVLRPRGDNQIRVRSLDFDGVYESSRGSLAPPDSSWQRFFVGLIEVFEEQLELPGGFDALFAGDIPHGAGLSSSAALTVAWMNAFRCWTDVSLDDWTLVGHCQRVEHEYLGVACGLLDQVGSHFSRPQHVMEVDFHTMNLRHVPAELPGLSWVVFHTGIRRELADSEFPIRVRECQEGLRAVQAMDSTVKSMRDVGLRHLSGDATWSSRLHHLVLENERVKQASECFMRGDVVGLGALVLQTHESLRNLYAVSCPELDALVDIAAENELCWGGRMVGGGFGGCTLNLVQADGSEAFIERTMAVYKERFDLEPRGFCFDLVGGAKAQFLG